MPPGLRAYLKIKRLHPSFLVKKTASFTFKMQLYFLLKAVFPAISVPYVCNPVQLWLVVDFLWSEFP